MNRYAKAILGSARLKPTRYLKEAIRSIDIQQNSDRYYQLVIAFKDETRLDLDREPTLVFTIRKAQLMRVLFG